MADLREHFGDIDIYLFDQLLRGRLRPDMTLLDAGCGYGRNLVYLLRAGYDVRGIDLDPSAVDQVRRLAAESGLRDAHHRFHIAPVEDMPFPTESADAILSSAVLHFARDDAHFEAMLREMWRVLKHGGLFFCRLASSIGIEPQVVRLDGRRHLLPDGSERFLVDASLLDGCTAQLGARLLDPIKTTVVHKQRAMTTWVLEKI